MESSVNSGENKFANTPEIGLWKALGGVITSPGVTFEKLARGPLIGKPILVLSLLALIFNAPFYSKFYQYTLLISKKTLLNSPQIPAGTDTAQMLNMAATAGAISSIVMSVLGIILFPIIFAALMKLLNFVMGEEAKFKQLWSVAIFAQVPSLMSMLLANLLMLTASGDNLITTFTLRTSLATLVPVSSVPHFLFALLANINVFSIWGMVLAAIGTAKVFRSSAIRVGAVIFGVWLVYVLITAYFGQAKLVELLS